MEGKRKHCWPESVQTHNDNLMQPSQPQQQQHQPQGKQKLRTFKDAGTGPNLPPPKKQYNANAATTNAVRLDWDQIDKAGEVTQWLSWRQASQCDDGSVTSRWRADARRRGQAGGTDRIKRPFQRQLSPPPPPTARPPLRQPDAVLLLRCSSTRYYESTRARTRASHTRAVLS